jgi:drug/metabolite transporter (DMT)-like permease
MGLWSIVMVLGSLYPIMTVVLAAGIHKERLMKIQYYGIAFAILGVAIISAGGGA